MRIGPASAAWLVGFTLASPCWADPPDPDPWFGRDKVLHFTVSGAIAAGGYGIGTTLFDGYAAPAALGAGLALTAGIGKEAMDAAGYGTPSWKDLTWDVAGTATGVGIALLVHLAVRDSDNGSSTPPMSTGAALVSGPIPTFSWRF